MKINLIVALYLALVHPVVLANNSINVTAILEEADSYKKSDIKHSQFLLDKLDVSTLTQAQGQSYIYLNAHNLAMTGHFDLAIEKLEYLISTPLSDTMKQRSLSILIMLYAGTRSWHKGMHAVSLLESSFVETLPDEAVEAGHLSLLTFYNELEQYELASRIAQKVIQTSRSPESLCKATSGWLTSQLYLHPEQLTLLDFDKGWALCETSNRPILIHFIAASQAEYWLKTNQYTQALTLLNDRLAAVEQSNYPPLTAGYYDLLMQVYAKLGQVEQATKYAKLNIVNEDQHQYKATILKANRILATFAEQQEDYQSAMFYFKNVLEEENSRFDQEVTKLLAIQNAKLDDLEKSNHINLLGKENSLLKTQAALVDKQSQNERLALALVSMLLLMLIIWSYRSRRFQLQFRRMAQTDELTGIANRHHFSEQAHNNLNFCRKSKQPLSFIIFDLDNFKNINDRFGHQIGDWALKAAVTAAHLQCRKNDIIGRIGGEEFAILLPGCDVDRAVTLAESCRAAIAAISSKETGNTFEVTASFGVTDTHNFGYNFDKLFVAADDALYQSKKSGRNKVYCNTKQQLIKK
jgi:diguanylate cyclase (GGDEF)-like protein